MLNSQETRIFIETSYEVESREITFQQYRENLAKAGVFRWLQISMNIKILLYLDNSLLFTESIQYYTNLSTLNHNVRFSVSAPGALVHAIRKCAKPCVHRFNYS